MYTGYYGLTVKPFQLSPDPDFFFGSSGHKRAMAYLRYGLSQSEGFVVITGGIGTGKTTVVKNLFKELDRERTVAVQLVTTQLEADDLLGTIAAAFGLPIDSHSKAALIQRFETFLQDCARAGKRVLLVIDEAQNLPIRSLEELRMLSNFQIDNTPLLQSFLLGQEGFRATLQAPAMEQLRQRVIASCHLNPLTERETCDYIEHRLHIAGWQGNPHFTEQAYAAIHHLTGGLPRRINLVCDRLLLYGCMEELETLSETEVNQVGEELFQDNAPPVPAAQGGETDNGVRRRLLELEQAVDALIEHPAWQDAQMERLERRVLQLEPVVQALQRQLAMLARQEEPSEESS